MLQHQTDRPKNDSPINLWNQRNQPLHGSFGQMHQSINLPNFEASQVISQNKGIDIKYNQDKPFANFLLRANELGYDAQMASQQTIELVHATSIKYPFHDVNTVYDQLSPFASRNYSVEGIKVKPLRKVVGKKIEKVADVLVELDIIRIQIWDYLGELKQELIKEFQKYGNKWGQVFGQFQKYFKQIYQAEVNKRLKLQKQAQQQLNRIEELQVQKNNIGIDELLSKQKIQELQVQIKRLNDQIQHLSAQGAESKSQLKRISEYQAKISNYENQIYNLNANLDDNSQYIFDLQQKIANISLKLTEKENAIRKQYEISLNQEKQNIELQFTAQFEKMQEQMKQKAMEELYHQYKESIDRLNKEHQTENQQLKRELQQQYKNLQRLKAQYQAQLSHLEQQKMNLFQQVRDYQRRLHQYEQKNMMAKNNPKTQDKIKIQELSIKLREIQQKFKDKQAQLVYYKQMKCLQDNTINCRPKRISNSILVMDESLLERSIMKQSAISPSSAINQKYGKSRQFLIDSILSRIKMRQEGSVLSQIHDNSFQKKNQVTSTLRPVSPESILIEKQKDVRMKNISSKLEQLRSDIRRQIGMLKN